MKRGEQSILKRKQGLYSTENSFQRIGEVEWRVSPQVFSDIHNIIAKHGMGLPDLDEDMRQALFGGRKIGPDAAALEIIEKYGLRPYVPLKLVVDYKMVVPEGEAWQRRQ